MSIAQIAPGETMLLSPGIIALLTALGGTETYVYSGVLPSAIANLSGWWDGGALTDVLDNTGAVIPDWTETDTIASVRDKSGAGRSMLPSAAGAIAIPHLSGVMGGLGKHSYNMDDLFAPLWYPFVDSSLTWSIANVPFGSGQAWTRYFVWSRPNFRQYTWTASAATDTDLITPITLLAQGSTVILAADPGPTGRLILFPGTSQTILTSGLTRRHTHNLILRNTPGSGVDVWLDGIQVATAATNPLTATATATLTLLGAASGSNPAAQCYFHEFATWEHALVAADINTLISCTTRWLCGARKGFNIILNGQSNALNFTASGAPAILQNAIRYYLGALSVNVVWGPPDAIYFIASGTGLYSPTGDFLHDPGNGSNPSTWTLGSNMTTAASWIASLGAYDVADFCGILWLWNETDSSRAYSEKATFTAAIKSFVALERALCGQTAPTMPLMFWNPIPYAGAAYPGEQMIREAFVDICADITQNAYIVMPQTSDSNGNGATPVVGQPTGTWSTGDPSHRDAGDHIIYARRGALPIARALAASGRNDSNGITIPAALPAVGGPTIVSATRQSSTSILVTVVHDKGNNLLLPNLAATGVGWSVMDGGSMSAIGSIVSVSSVTVVDPTHLLLTLTTALKNTSGLLYYPFESPGFSWRGDAVTDNYSTVAKPAGWDIGADLGSAYTLDYPLRATAYGIPC